MPQYRTSIGYLLVLCAALYGPIASPALAQADSASAPAGSLGFSSDLAADLVVVFEAGPDYLTLRRQAVGPLGPTDGELEALQTHPDWRVRTQAAVVLGWRRTPELFASVLQAHPVPGRAQRIARFVTPPFRDQQARPAVIERLVHGLDPDVVRSGLVMALVDTDPDWADDVVALVGVVDQVQVLSTLVATLRRAEPLAAQAGIQVGLSHPESQVRAEAARSLGWRADGAVLGVELLPLLRDESTDVRAMAARTAGWLGLEAAASVLEDLVDDQEAEVRLHALRSLHRMAPLRAERLASDRSLERDPDPRVARVARRVNRR